jgi:hypothetical protein
MGHFQLPDDSPEGNVPGGEQRYTTRNARSQLVR